MDRRYITLIFPPGAISVANFTVQNREIVTYKEIRIKEYSIALAGNGPFPAKLDLRASSPIFTNTIQHGVDNASFTDSAPLVLHNRQNWFTSEGGAATTQWDHHYPYPYTVASSHNKIGYSTLPGNITFTLSSSNATLPPIGNYPGNAYPSNTATLAQESIVVLELITVDPKFIPDPLNSKLSIPDSWHV